MRYINTTNESITFIDVDGKTKVVPLNRVWFKINQDTITFLFVNRYEREGVCLFTTRAEDVTINGTVYTIEQLKNGEGVDELFGAVGITLTIVEELPQTGENGVIYLIANGQGSYTEYIWIEEEQKYEELGDVSDVDLSNYYTKEEVDELIAESGHFDPNKYYTKSEIDAALDEKEDASDAFSGDYNDLTNKPVIPVVPTDVSAFNNDAGYLTEHQSLTGYATESWVEEQGYLTEHQSLADYYTKSEVDAELDTKQDASEAFSGDYNDLTNKPVIPVVPTDVSAFNNDAGYLTEHQSLDDYYTKSETEEQFASKVVVNQEISGRIQADADLQSQINAKADKSDTYTKTQVDELIPDVSDFFDGAEYDSESKHINFLQGNVVKAYVDATDFIKDGMVDTVEIVNNNLVITFNTDAGKEAITIPLTNIFDPSNYYTKSEVDAELDTKLNVEDAFSGDYNDLSNQPVIPTQLSELSDDVGYLTETDADERYTTESWVEEQGYLTEHQSLEDYYTKSEVDAELDTKQDASEAFSGDYNDLTNKPVIPVVPTNVSAFTNDAGYLTEHQSLTGYATENWVENQGYLTEHQSLEDYYTKSETDALIPDTSDFLTKSEFDTKEEVISTALNELEDEKQDKLTAGANITITNNVISASGAAQLQSDWNQSDSTAVDFIKNKPSLTNYYTKSETDDTFVSKSVYNQKEIATSKALTQLNDNKADKSTTYTKTEVDGLIPTVPTNVSAFTNDAGYLTQHQSLSNYYTKTETDNTFVSQADFDVKEEVISTALNDLYNKIGDIERILASL